MGDYSRNVLAPSYVYRDKNDKMIGRYSEIIMEGEGVFDTTYSLRYSSVLTLPGTIALRSGKKCQESCDALQMKFRGNRVSKEILGYVLESFDLQSIF
ncbi:hypothetical protein V1478_009799 [Vespula squamosa]|uniref:Uncharacterized protein n=1 Tax=Vespula squamosa TaxID=30214 RepID=A0ABD2AJE3_VESSQ